MPLSPVGRKPSLASTRPDAGLSAKWRAWISRCPSTRAIRSTARAFPNSGLVDSNGAPVTACRAPNPIGSTQFDQLECYCTTTTCGAGMLDAGAAVTAVLGLRAAFNVAPAAPQANQAVTLDSSGSTVAAGRTLAARQWTLVNGGGIVAGFTGASNGVTASLTPTAAGSFVVQLTVTDDRGTAVSTQQTVTVSAAGGGSSGGGGGGGPMGWTWLAGLAVASGLLRKKQHPD